jgi:hypothetical protein
MKMQPDATKSKMRGIYSPYNHPVLILLIVLCLLVAGSPDIKVKTAVQWQPWEASLKANHKQNGRPSYLEAIFTGPRGETFKSPGFTDDGAIFHFRAAFPSAGTWKWKSVCSDQGDKGLHNRKGKAEVKPYTGDNPLYKHGDLKVSKDKRYLVYADGTPFLWMGETGWRMTQQSAMDEWHYYIDTRAAQKFTEIQISPRGVSKKPETELEEVSFKPDNTPDPVFWQDLEAKVRYANDKGIAILMVGISKDWSDKFLKNPANQPFETYITGRLAPFMVLFSPSFDQAYMKGNDSVAVELKKYTTHLVTQHAGTNYEANLTYRNAVSVDFCGMQSGHHGGNLQRAYNAARSWTLDMWNAIPVKPVVDIEAMYDAYGDNSGKNWREKDARKLGWIAWLSGSRGYTYGCGDVPPKVPKGAGGVWRFNKDASAYDYWRKAILWKSAGQMTIMHDFFKSFEWWKLAPSHEVILNQAINDTVKMVASINADKSLLVVYMPDNPEVILDLSSMTGTLTGKWFNTVTGNYVPVGSPVIPAKKVSFSRPGSWEDALLEISNR